MKITKKLCVSPEAHSSLMRIKEETGISIVRLIDSATEICLKKYGLKSTPRRPKAKASA